MSLKVVFLIRDFELKNEFVNIREVSNKYNHPIKGREEKS